MTSSPTGADGRPLEIEMKYRVVNPAAGERWLGEAAISGFVAVAGTIRVVVVDQYLDTASGALRGAGYVARIRRDGTAATLTVKSTAQPTGSGAVHRRLELEGPAGPELDPGSWPDSAARSLLVEQTGGFPLVELVSVRQDRRKRILERNGTAVELSLDHVAALRDGATVDTFDELEIELIRGDEADLAPLEARFSADPGLAPARSSKLQSALDAVARAGASAATPVAPLAPVADVAATPRTRAPVRDGAGTGSRPPAARRSRRAAATTTVTGPASSRGAGPMPRAAAPGRAPAALPDAAPEPSPAETPAAASPKAARPKAARPKAASRGAASPKTARPKAAVAKLAAPKNPGVVGDDTIAEAGRKVLRFHLARMIAREPGTRDGSDPEQLHAMRVATRRQRAAWRIFGEGFRSAKTRPYRTHVREVARRLGAVRDMDVLLEGLENDRAKLPDAERQGLEPLAAAWRVARDEARVLLVRELDSARHRRWLEDYTEFARSEGRAARAVEGATPNRVRDTAPSRILAAHERVRAYEVVLKAADVATLHELRIAAKWLRYSIEFVREPLGPDAEPLIARVTALQDHLGLLHDADVAAAQARDLVASRARALSGDEIAAIDRYAARCEARREALVRSVGPAWHAVAGLEFRRRLGRVLAGL